MSLLSNVVVISEMFRISSCVPFTSHLRSIKRELDSQVNDAALTGVIMSCNGTISARSTNPIYIY